MQVAIEAAQKTGRIVETAICYTGDVSDPRRTKYDLKYYVDLAKELVQPRHAPAGDQGHGGPAQAARRDDAGQGAQGRGRRAAAPAHARHLRQQHRDVHGRDRGGRRRRRRRGQQHGGHDVAAVAVVAGVRARGLAARSRASTPTLRAALELLGAGARLLRALRVGPERRPPPTSTSTRSRAASTRTCARRPRRWASVDGGWDGGQARLRRRQPPVRRHPQGDAVVEGRRRHGDLDGEAEAGRARGDRARRTS